MIPNELRENPKLMRLRRVIRTRIQRGDVAEAESLILWIDQAIADWSREERRRRKARKRRA